MSQKDLVSWLSSIKGPTSGSANFLEGVGLFLDLESECLQQATTFKRTTFESIITATLERI